MHATVASAADPGPALFIAASYSPWSERARWALDHHGIHYREVAYVPMLGTPWLRLKTRKWRGKVSVPALVAGHVILRDSVEIARWADSVGRGARLFADPGVDAWIRRSDTIMDNGRALAVPRVIRDPAARREGLPAFVPGALRGVLDPMARMGAGYIAKKYGLGDYDQAQALGAMRQALVEVRGALAGGRDTLLADFSFADVAVAASLTFVAPMPSGPVKMGPAMRVAYTVDELRREFADVLAWRYATRRNRTGS
jgi:glutathione S-transferase